MSPIAQRHATLLMVLSISPSLASPLAARPSFGRVARNLLPFRCDVVPGDHAGLVDGLDCEWDWWAHAASDFAPQPTDQWDEAQQAPACNNTLRTGNRLLDAGCRLLDQTTGPEAVACMYQDAETRERTLGEIQKGNRTLVENCSWGPFPITCIYTQAKDHDCQHESCEQNQQNLQSRTEHEWEHFDTVSEKDAFLMEHPELQLMGCKHAFGDEWCYFESPDDPTKRIMSKFGRALSNKRRRTDRYSEGVFWTSSEANDGTTDVVVPSNEKRTLGCAQTHDYRCDFFDNGILKHAICVFFNSEDKDLYIKTHADFQGRPALCNLLNSGPGLICGFDLKGSKLASPPGKIVGAALTSDRNESTRTSSIKESDLATAPASPDDAKIKSPRTVAAANFDSTLLVESVWPGTTSSTTTTTKKTMETVIPDHTRTGTAVVDVNQTSTSTSTTTMKTAYMVGNTLTRTVSQTVIQFKPVPETVFVRPHPTTTTIWTTSTDSVPPCKTASCCHEDEEATAVPVCSPPTCTDTPEVKECLQAKNDTVSHCNENDDLCRCRAYDALARCFDPCQGFQHDREKAQNLHEYYCSKVKMAPPLVDDDKKAIDGKKDGSDPKSGALAPTIPLSSALLVAVFGAAALLI